MPAQVQLLAEVIVINKYCFHFYPACYAECGNATASRLSICLSVSTFRYVVDFQ